jgi:protein SCO1/2
MRFFTSMNLSKIIVPAVLAAVTWGAAHAAETNSAARSCCRLRLPATAFTEKSLYQDESEWTTDAGRNLKLGALAGRPQIVLMFFSHCTTACPILVNDLRRIQAAMTPAERAAVGVTLVSFDSERDTPPALAAYRRDWKLPVNWTLLHGSADNVAELAALLGVQYKKLPDGQFAHSNVITLLDANGEIKHQQAGLAADPKPLVEAIAPLADLNK